MIKSTKDLFLLALENDFFFFFRQNEAENFLKIILCNLLASYLVSDFLNKKSFYEERKGARNLHKTK